MTTIDAHQFAAYLATEGKADSTIRNYRALFARWVDWSVAHDRDPWQPDPLSVRAWSAQLHGSRELLAQARATIGHLCAALEVDDVSTAIPLPRKPRRGPRPLDRAVAIQLARYAPLCGLRGTAVLVGLTTAMRRSEIAQLRWDGLDFAGRLVRFYRPKLRDWHTVAMHPVLAAHLEPRQTGEQFVFPTANQGHVSPTTIGDWISAVAEAAGVGHVTSHRLRHTALTEAYDATRDLRAVQDLAGHTSPAQTAIYTRSSAAANAAAVAGIDLFGEYPSDAA